MLVPQHRTIFLQAFDHRNLLALTPCIHCLWQGRTRPSNTGTERHDRDRSRERSSRRSSSPPSPPLPDISVPFYMLPRTEEPELSVPPTSRPQLISYPHLTNTGRRPLLPYPAPQTHDSTAAPAHVAYPTSAQKLSNSSAQSETAMCDTGGLPAAAATRLEPYQ